MAFQVSPGVLVTEKDLTNVIPAVSTTAAGIVITAEKGPIDEVTTITSENELVDTFGKPNSSNFEEFFTAANFLGYGNNLKVVRPITGLVNAVSTGTAVLIKNTTQYLNDYYSETGAGQVTNIGTWAAREAGTLGNSIKVSLCPNSTAFGPHSQSGTLTNDATAAIGDTTITMDDGSLFQVGDILEFGDASNVPSTDGTPSGFFYKVTAINTHVLTIARFNTATGQTESGGLRHAVVDNAKVLRHWEYYFNFDGPPTTTDDVSAAGGSNDEMHIAVIDEDGSITGTAGEILETFAGVSQAHDAKDASGNSNYYADVIYRNSKFIYWIDHISTLSDGASKTGTTFDNTVGDAFVVSSTSLSGGTDDYAATNAEIATAYEKFNDVENVDLGLLLCGPSQTGADATGDTKATAVMDIATARKDCVAFISPARADVVNVANAVTQTQNVVGFADGLPSSSYAVIDSGYKYMYDKYNDVFRFVPLNGDTAGLCARTDNIADPFFSPAGFNRGQIRGAVKLAFNPNQTQRDELYKARVNPVVSFPGQGTVLFGDKTAQSKPSAFDRINVRRLFITLEKAISTAAKFQLFEFNDEFTRAQFRNLVEPFLRDVQGRRGITEFTVVCDDSNNTGDVIDRNEFRADIFVKPARSINFIQLNFIATRSGVAFTEVAGA
ncbi:tail sheath protein [uncultured Mediterranean phage]|nr:tail sheath protein [uncultured Mediterranean phage]